MNQIPINLPTGSTAGEYLDFLRKAQLPFVMGGGITIPGEVVESADSLLSSGGGITFRREKDVRAIADYFFREHITRPVKLRFPFYIRENAYMTDGGRMYISRFFLHRSGGQRVMKVLLHEIAHLWISCSPDYARLLKLDSACAGISEISGQEILAPVEFAATALETEMMAALALAGGQNAGMLRSMAIEENKRINTAIQSLRL